LIQIKSLPEAVSTLKAANCKMNLARGEDIVMAAANRTSGAGGTTPKDFAKLGEKQSEAMLAMQQELADVCEQISRGWLARLKTEQDLWSELATKMSGARSMPDAIAIYQECAAQRVQMAADDGRRLFEDSQKIMSTMARSMTQG
jgi:phasin protein